MLHELYPALVITLREVRDQFRDWRILFPVAAITLFFPFLMNFTAEQILQFVEHYGANIIGERLVPFLLMIVGFFPISVSLVIALESFVGEKERGSIEPLLNTPLKDWQLYLGKLLSATVPPLAASCMGMSVYLGGLYVKDIPWPETAMLAQIFVLTTVQAVVMVAGAVVVSSQATSVRAANLLASFIIIPIALLIQGESIVMFWGDYSTLWWGVIGLFVLAVMLVRVGLAHFQREELLGREIDVLNLRWAWRKLWAGFTGGAQNVWDWYRKVLPRALHGLGTPSLIVTLLMVIGFILGARLVNQYKIPIFDASLNNLNERLSQVFKLWPMFSFRPVLAIWWQNLRVLLVAMIAGSFTMGILSVMPLMATMGVAGYLFGTLTSNGLSHVAFLGLILPHGILEIPLAILSTAAVLKSGALLSTPDHSRTIGEVFLASLAEWLKIMIGLVVPLMLAAAMVEAWITPRLFTLLFP